MEANIELRPLFSYSYTIIIVFIIILILTILFKFLYYKFIYGRKFKDKIKKKYLKKLDRLERTNYNPKIEIRTVYLNLSAIIRDFIYEMTDIKVQNYTLSDIKKINIPYLGDLISEYYKPEFEEISSGDMKKSIERTRKVIEGWK